MRLLLQLVRENFTKPASLVSIFLRRLWPSIKLRLKTLFFGPYHPIYYPKELREPIRIARSSVWTDIDRKRKAWPFIKPLNVNSDKNSEYTGARLQLVGTELELKELLDFWRKGGPAVGDSEFISSLHRFHWLLKFASDASAQTVLTASNRALIEWAVSHPTRNIERIEFAPYCISERVSNWIAYLQLLLVSNLEVEDLAIIEDSLRKDVVFLLEHLEYPASGIVNNHILNNARALYFAGVYFNSPDLLGISKRILRKHLPILIGPGGFLLEASSHYQMLLTRSVLEVSLLSVFDSEPEFTLEMNSLSDRMIGASQFLLFGREHYSSSLPLIGDVSPDCAPTWFMPVPNQSKYGWQQCWDYQFLEQHPTDKGVVDGWVRIINGEYALTTYLHPDKDIFPLGHGHTDFGSFTLQHNNEFVFVDVGRYSYSVPEVCGPDGVTNKHNCIYIGNTPAIESKIGLNASLKKVASQQHDYDLDIQNSTLGFKAISSHSRWDRSICIKDDGALSMSDEIKGHRNVIGYVNLSPEAQIVELSNLKFCVRTRSAEFSIQLFGVASARAEYCLIYPAYGVKKRTSRIRWNSHSEAGYHQVRLLLMPTGSFF